MINMSAIWAMEIPTAIFSKITENFSEDLKIKYKMQKQTVNGVARWKNFSTSQVSEKPPIFPYITVIQLPGQERQQDLEGNSINAALFTFQVDVFDNSKESIAKGCMEEILRIMKSMQFQVNAMPAFDSKFQQYRMTVRFQRIIGAGDGI